MATKKDKPRGIMMTDAMKESYKNLFTDALDEMEATNYTKPWVSLNMGRPCNLYRQKHPYRKSNAFWLAMLCQLKGWETPFFITKTELKNEDGSRKYKGLKTNCTLVTDEDGAPKFNDKGLPVFEYEHRFPVVFFKPQYKDKDGNRLTDEEYRNLTPEEQDECRTWWMQQTYRVWNIDQTNFKELYPEAYAEMTKVPEHEYKAGTRDEVLEQMIEGGKWRCAILFGGHSSHYSPMDDHIRLPERSRFLGDHAFYATAIHEMAHSTAKELKRSQDGPFGSEEYAMEEFVAELTAACVCSMLGIGKLLDQNHIAYVQNWRKALKDNTDFIPLVIDAVQSATNYILRHYDAVNREMHPLALPMAA